MAFLLLIETATPSCSVAVSRGEKVLALREHTGMQDHARWVTVFIAECLEQVAVPLTAVDAVVVSRGPGSYTSLRIGASVAKGICYALDIPLIAIDTLQALALGAHLAAPNGEALYVPMIDARRMEVYYAVFDAQNNALTEKATTIVTPSAFDHWLEQGVPVIFTGNAADKVASIITHPQACFLSIECSARFLVPLALSAWAENRTEDIATFTPFYLKPPNITKPGKKLL